MNCLQCFHYKSKTFFKDKPSLPGLPGLKEWCEQKEVVLRKLWLIKLMENGLLKIYWCNKEPNPAKRMHSIVDRPFRKDCKYGDFYEIYDDGTLEEVVQIIRVR